MSIKLTKEQAERCMRADPEFEVKAVDIFRMTPGGDIQYFNLNFNQWRSPFNSWQDAVQEATKFNNITIHSDPNKTYETLFRKTDMTNETEQKYLTTGQALDLLIAGETLTGMSSTRTHSYEFELNEGSLVAITDGSLHSTWNLNQLLYIEQLQVKPQPDSPEKFVRRLWDFSRDFSSEGRDPSTFEEAFEKEISPSLQALIQQMDKEGK